MESVDTLHRAALLYEVAPAEALWRIGSHPTLYCLEADLGSDPVRISSHFLRCGPESAPQVRRGRMR